MKHALPKPSDEARAQSQQLTQLIHAKIASQGALSFADYMHLALYTPGLGYYSSNLQKFGAAGDFITAPEISPLFGRCLASAFDSALAPLKNPVLLELGAGTGRLAADILKNLKQPIDRYYILEISADLRMRQQHYLKEHSPAQFHLIEWLDALPKDPITGIIFGNEIIDALPVTCFEAENHRVFERKVGLKDQQFIWENHPASSELEAAVRVLALPSIRYQSEINLCLKDWLSSFNHCLAQGLIFFIDYGFSEREYYHPQRSMGTLNCHYRHLSHPDPFVHPGLQDITAHVNFTQLAMIADDLGLNVEGYATQANFLIDHGIESLAGSPDFAASKALQTLLFPHEMGELFKVMVLSKNYPYSQTLVKTDWQYKL